MKFKKGDKVRVRQELREGKDFAIYVNTEMLKYRDKILTVRYLDCGLIPMRYTMKECSRWCWTDDMLIPVTNYKKMLDIKKELMGDA